MSSRPDPAAPAGAVVHQVPPLGHPVDAVVRPPGSKSLTNRALVIAALASGTSTLAGVLESDDTAAMADCVMALGADVRLDPLQQLATVVGCDGRPAAGTDSDPIGLFARLSGTTARFVLAACALGPGPYVVDGAEPLRRRPMGGALDALRTLGATVADTAGGLPVTVSGGPVTGGVLTVDGAVSSQFLSGLAMAGACMPNGLRVVVPGALVSRPYVTMTQQVMQAFGASIEVVDQMVDTPDGTVEGLEVVIGGGGYRACDLRIESDASAASYFLAAAAVCGGTVRVEGVGRDSVQGDIGFADVLADMGATVRWGSDWVELTGPPPGGLRGISVGMSDISDTAPTLAAVAVFATGPTTVTGVGFIRHKETDRIGSVVTELHRMGIGATETDDGFVVHPGPPQPSAVRTYDDHRMAMAFAVVGLAADDIEIVDPGCVDKTYPGFFDDLDRLRRQPGTGR
jgi:3-phosphoshikimate 1-carboxyvinyltransferase